MGLLLRLGPNVITDGTFITFGSRYYTCAFYSFPLQIDMSCLPYIDKGKPVGSWFGQMVRKIQDRYISCRNRFYRLYRSVAFTEKQPHKSETSIKDSVLLMVHERYTNFRLKQQEYLFRCSVAPGDFPLERLIYFPSGLSGNFW